MFTAPRQVQDAFTYRGPSGQWAWMFHRLAGLGTILFVLIHVLDTSTVYFVPSLYTHAIELYRNPIFGIGEVILMACVIYHAVNGLRITIQDLRPDLEIFKTQQQIQTVVWIGFLILFVPAAAIMLSRIAAHVMGGSV